MTEIDTDKLVQRLNYPLFGTETSERLLMESAAIAILAMAEDNKRMREALERVALSGDGEDVFERSTLYGTFQTIARRALSGIPKEPSA